MMIQGSQEWMDARLGRATASRVADIVAKTRSGWGASRANYMAELIAERLTGVNAATYTNSAMQWGTDHEPQARALYELMVGADVTEVGFIDHPTIAMSGASPDGLVGDVGLVELKAPNTATHIETLRGGKISDRYIVQVQFQMACTGRAWCDFCSFDPRMPPEMQLFVQRVRRDDARIAELEKEVSAFLAEVDATVRDLTKRYAPPLNILSAG